MNIESLLGAPVAAAAHLHRDAARASFHDGGSRRLHEEQPLHGQLGVRLQRVVALCRSRLTRAAVGHDDHLQIGRAVDADECWQGNLSLTRHLGSRGQLLRVIDGGEEFLHRAKGVHEHYLFAPATRGSLAAHVLHFP